jgi:hypothetical protein
VQHGISFVRQRDAVIHNGQTVLNGQISVRPHIVNARQNLIQARLELTVWLDVLA